MQIPCKAFTNRGSAFLNMYLKEVILEGFKSFADRTKVILGPGVTTIVGPNGCGKSNIVDAIRWVLGEQSAKALRGGKMNDVIFEGSDKRAALPVCEVSLVFTDCEKELGTAFNEVQITRRVSREGGGNYYINGKACRLKDIQQLFMDTGIGRVSYSFMVQGQIDQILSTNPEERRVIFEEAAGITRYKAQRREAMNKLALVDQNLSRINDVIDEVGRQITALKRQASKAIRFKRVSHRLKHLDLGWNSFQYQEKHALIESLTGKVGELRDVVQAAQQKLTDGEVMLAERKEERRDQYEKLQSIQQGVFDITSKKDQAENLAHVSMVRQQDYKDRIAVTEKDILSLEKQQKDLEAKMEDTSVNRESQMTLVDASDNLYKEKNKVLLEIQDKLRVLEGNFQKEKQKLHTLRGEIDRLQSKRSSLEVDLQTNEAREKDLEESIKDTEEQFAQIKEKLSSTEAAVKTVQETVAKCEKELDAAQKVTIEKREKFKAAQHEIQDQDRKIARLNAQLSVLEAMQSRFEGFSEVTKSIMKGKLDSVLEKGKYDLLTKHIEVVPEYITAFEVLLGMGVDAVSLQDMNQLADVAPFLADKKWAKACFNIPVPEQKENRAKKIPTGIVKAIDCVKSRSDSLTKNIEALLKDCYFCDSLTTFLSIWKDNPDFIFSLVATQSGELIDARGLVFTPNYESQKKKDGGFIQREAEIRELRTELQKEQKQLEALSNKSKDHHTVLEDSEADVEQKKNNLAAARQELTTAQLEDRSTRNHSINLEQKVKQFSDRRKQFTNNIKEAKERYEKGSVELEQKQEELSKIDEVIKGAEDDITQCRQDRDLQMEAVSELRVDLAEKKQLLQHIAHGLSQIEQRKQGTAHMLNTRQRELHTYQDEVAKLGEAAVSAKTQVEEFIKAMNEAKANLEKQRQVVTAVEEALNQVEAVLNEQRKIAHEKEGQLAKLEIQLTQATSQERFITEKMSSEYHVEIEEIDWVQQLWLADEEFKTKISLDDLEEDKDFFENQKKHKGSVPTKEELEALQNTAWPEVKNEIDELKSKISSMGAVNLVAIEEYAELKERFEFLKTQSEDLTNSKNELLTAIEEINKTSEKMFHETFQKVRNNFSETFNALFGGGHADLILQESDDVLDSGIEIIARPPGTKLKSLTLLSGGQKTMTAVALLFAIYRVKPSPFCVLDELDAPLDDANIGRFVKMLRDFTQFSQFLVISHNKRTIAAADTIYGVTMQERGVTRLISMRFNKNEQREKELDEVAFASVR